MANQANQNQHYGLQIVETTFGEYAIAYTEQEAEEAARQDIENSVWTFQPDFLAFHCDCESEHLAKIQQELGEDANEVFRKLITDFDHFVEDAIRSYGRGRHFLVSYDSEEKTLTDLDEEEAQEIRDELEDLEDDDYENLLIYRL